MTDRQLSRFNLRGTEHYSSASFSPCGRWFGFEGKVYHTRRGTELFAPISIDREGQATGTLLHLWINVVLPGRPAFGRANLRKRSRQGGNALGVWELASGRLITRITDPRSVAQMAFSSDGRTIALVDGLGAHVHDLLTGRRLAEFATPDIMGGMIVTRDCCKEYRVFTGRPAARHGSSRWARDAVEGASASAARSR